MVNYASHILYFYGSCYDAAADFIAAESRLPLKAGSYDKTDKRCAARACHEWFSFA